MLRIQVLASGSSGNATLVRAGRTAILLDAGISARRLTRGLRAAGLEPGDLSAIFVSHEHGDHIAGLPVFLKKRTIPLFMAPESREAARLDGTVGAVEPLSGGCGISLGPLTVTPFRLPHDAACTFGFVLEAGGVRAVQATDLGVPTALLMERVRGAHCLLLEFNHDLDRLMASGYPLDLKMRVKGRLGHLSNGQAASVIRECVNGETRALFLMHLSAENNLPALALMAAREALRERDPVRVAVAERHEPTEAWEG